MRVCHVINILKWHYYTLIGKRDNNVSYTYRCFVFINHNFMLILGKKAHLSEVRNRLMFEICDS